MYILYILILPLITSYLDIWDADLMTTEVKTRDRSIGVTILIILKGLGVCVYLENRTFSDIQAK